MRLICPNCGAQYEVDDKVIPGEGRDVQCSSCGHTWFQRPAHLDQDLADELDIELPDQEEPATVTAPPPSRDNRGTPDAAPSRVRRSLDPEVADVLREEAAREAEVRRAERTRSDTRLETQPDLGLDDGAKTPPSRSEAARARIARMRGGSNADSAADEAAAAAVAADSSRRELLPDIEEINSSLRASGNRTTDQADESEDGQGTGRSAGEGKRGGFRLGFMLIVLIALAAVLVYAFAPQIVETVPAAEPYMTSYLDWANEMRTRTDDLIALLVEKMRDLTGNGATP